jgi:FkbM family methyltransferase
MVIAFEPQAALAACLRETLAMSGARVEVHKSLVSDSVQELKFCSDGTGRSRIPITSSTQQVKLTQRWPVQAMRTTTVDLMVLDREDLPSAPVPRVCVIKIDVEGHDFEVLKGAERVITQDRPVIYIEVWQEKGEVRVRKAKWRTDHSAFGRLEQWAKDRYYVIERLTANDYRLWPLSSSNTVAPARGQSLAAQAESMRRGQEQALRLLACLEDQKRVLLERGEQLRK